MSQCILVDAVASVTLNDIAESIAGMEPFEVSDFFLMVVEKQENPLLAKSYSERLMHHYEKWLIGKKEYKPQPESEQ